MAKYLKQSRVERVLALFEPFRFEVPNKDKVVGIDIGAFNVEIYYEDKSLPFRTDGE